MKEYQINVTETLSRIVKIEAVSKEDAIRKVKSMYHNEEIVLDADDFVGVNIQERK